MLYGFPENEKCKWTVGSCVKCFLCDKYHCLINRGSYTSTHVLLNLLNELREKRSNARLAEHIISFFATSLTISIIQEYDC